MFHPRRLRISVMVSSNTKFVVRSGILLFLKKCSALLWSGSFLSTRAYQAPVSTNNLFISSSFLHKGICRVHVPQKNHRLRQDLLCPREHLLLFLKSLLRIFLLSNP